MDLYIKSLQYAELFRGQADRVGGSVGNFPSSSVGSLVM